MTCGRPVHLRMANDESPDRTSFQSKKCRQPKDEQRCSREYIVDTAMRHEYSHPGKQTGRPADRHSRAMPRVTSRSTCGARKLKAP